MKCPARNLDLVDDERTATFDNPPEGRHAARRPGRDAGGTLI